MHAPFLSEQALSSATRAPARGVATVRGVVRLWLSRWRTRRDLAALPPYMLRDIGLDPIAARNEAEKPFWRA
jgi:uncharacterized protein YjiS (DUF1127 family)